MTGTLGLFEASVRQVRGFARVDLEVELTMIDSQLIGDIALAALVALSSAAIAKPDTVALNRQAQPSAPAHNSVVALASAGDRQIGLYR